MTSIILDLCAGSGAWSQPYLDAGYDVRRVDLPEDVRLLPYLNGTIHGILAAPPCTYFCRMRMCRGRPSDAQFIEAFSVLDACLRAVLLYRPRWWAVENPEGYLLQWLGQPRLKFHPADYGDPWTKRTWVWGEFTLPTLAPTPVQAPLISSARRKGLARTWADRARTPPGFAQAFFQANP